MTTVRFAVSPGTMLERFTRDAAALLSFDIVSVADPNELLGLVVVAVKLALDLSEVTVRPMRMSAESAMPARRVVDLRIYLVPSSPPRWIFASRAAGTRGTIARGRRPAIRIQGETRYLVGMRFGSVERVASPVRGMRSLALEGLEDLGRVSVGLHPVPRLLHRAVRSQQHGRADHAIAPAGAIAPGAVGSHRLVGRVGKQGEAQSVLVAELHVRSGVIGRDADDRDARLLELLQVVVELAGFRRAARRVVLGVEVHDR